MRFSALREDLLKSVHLLQYSVSARGMMPILSGVKISSSPDSLTLTSNDLESSTTTTCSAQVEEEGTCAVNHKLLMEILRDIKDEKVLLSTVGTEMVLESGSSYFKLFTLPVEDFPTTPDVEHEVARGIEGKGFLKSVQRVSKAASKDEKRPTLMGILFEVGKGEIKMVSTDSYRLAVDVVRDGFEVIEEDSYIIPGSALLNLSRILADDEKIDMFRDENRGQVKFSGGGVDYTIRLIEGKFPKYEQFLPENVEKRVIIGKEEILGAIKRISLVNTVVKFNIEGEEMTVAGESREVGEGKETIKVDYNGDPVTIAFNSRFLEDGLASVDEEEIVIGITEPLKPGVIKGKSGEDFIYVIMPVRI